MTFTKIEKRRQAFKPTPEMQRDWNPSPEDEARLIEIEHTLDLSPEEGGLVGNERRKLQRENKRILLRSYGRDARFMATGDPTGSTPITEDTKDIYHFYRTIIELKELTDAALREDKEVT